MTDEFTISGYQLIERAKKNVTSKSFLTFRKEFSYYDGDSYSFILVINSGEEFNDLMGNIEIIHRELVPYSVLILSVQILNYIVEAFDSDKHYDLFINTFNAEWFSSSYTCMSFINDMYEHVKDDDRKVKILNKTKLLYTV